MKMSTAALLVSIAFVAIAVSMSGCSGDDSSSNPTGPGGINPNDGPSASSIFSGYSASVHQGIAGLTFSQNPSMTPGFLYYLNTAVVISRTTAAEIQDPPSSEPTGYEDSWYVHRDTVNQQAILTKMRWTPNPWRGGGAPAKFEQEHSTTYTASSTTTTTTIAFMNERNTNGKFSGTWNNSVDVSFSIPGIPAQRYESPYDWSNVDCSRANSLYTSPEGSFHAVGVAYLGMNQTNQLVSYNFEGTWVIPASVANGDSIGVLRVGGENFASYFFTGFNSVLGVYNGSYRLLGGSDQSLHPFTMGNQ
ncbi:MAG: hypothetical protein OEM52_13145 [bacterium]|nr:hypothetical protein [bacterium]